MLDNGSDIINPPNAGLHMDVDCSQNVVYAQAMATYSVAADPLSNQPSLLQSQQARLQEQEYMPTIVYPSMHPSFQLSNEFYEYGSPVTHHNSPNLNNLHYKSVSNDVSNSLAQHSAYVTSVAQQVPAASSSTHATATASDPCAQIAHVLQCYQQGGEDAEFVRKAIESLVKKLKDKRIELENLISAVTSGGKQPTSCVTIQRSLDGRLQVAGRKGVPHVVYARIWRWPNVNKNELQKLPICTVSSDNQDVICINPYHYERIVSSSIGNIDMSTLRLDSLTSLSSTPNQGNLMALPVDGGVVSHISGSQTDVQRPFQINQQQHQTSGGMIHSNGEELHTQWMNQSCSLNPSPSTQLYSNSSDAFPVGPCSSFRIGGLGRFDLNSVQLPPIGPLEHWCSITYYEFDTQVGETFKVRKDQIEVVFEVVVDGGVNPSATKQGRFCLGALPNVHRDAPSEKTRLHIGKGVRISTQRDGSVYLECLSHQSVYVRSYYLDFEHNSEYGMTVHKFCSGAPNRKIFDLRWAYAEMEQQSNSARLAVAAQAAAVAGIASPTSLTPSLIEHAGTGVDDLRRVCCTIAISFVKGWGPGYNRSSIKETPCWIEIQLHRPLQLLDQLLKKNNDYYSCKFW
ncbi:unnamed protein product [Enterobius vermicularis]|uniref:Mothers against decapentaplegic homolog n=1 Tax=Enterobius vermicularis TaxID=51028 RepID=A0A0N4V5V4_ENTVE|nr:unnamed protein product [Enterobius vermicularis]